MMYLGVNSIDIMNFVLETGTSSGPNSLLGHYKFGYVSNSENDLGKILGLIVGREKCGRKAGTSSARSGTTSAPRRYKFRYQNSKHDLGQVLGQKMSIELHPRTPTLDAHGPSE